MIQAITLLVIAALVAIDQVIKVAVVNRFAAGGSMDILFGLIRIRYVENTGAAFSSMQNQTVFLTIFTAGVFVLVLRELLRSRTGRQYRSTSPMADAERGCRAFVILGGITLIIPVVCPVFECPANSPPAPHTGQA